jgi:hypothetical protein
VITIQKISVPQRGQGRISQTIDQPYHPEHKYEEGKERYNGGKYSYHFQQCNGARFSTCEMKLAEQPSPPKPSPEQ